MLHFRKPVTPFPKDPKFLSCSDGVTVNLKQFDLTAETLSPGL